MTINDFLVPGIVVALASVVIQGMKSAVDLWLQLSARRVSIEQRRMAYVTTVCALIDALPLAEGDRIVAKQRIAQRELEGIVSEDVRIMLGTAGAEKGCGKGGRMI